MLNIIKATFALFWFGYLFFAVFSQAETLKFRKISQQENLAPLANDLYKSTKVNTPLFIQLSSLCRDLDGDKIQYMIIEKLPKYGTLSLMPSHEKTLFYTYHKMDNPEIKKFDGRRFRIQYLPDSDFVGKDHFQYSAYDSRGGKSQTGTIEILVDKLSVTMKNHPPIAYNFSINIPENQALYIDLYSLTFDQDGDYITPSLGPSQLQGQTFTILPHGIIEGGDWLNYLPQKTGTEIVYYSVHDEENTAQGIITINVEESRSLSVFRSVAMKIFSTPHGARTKLLLLIIMLSFGTITMVGILCILSQKVRNWTNQFILALKSKYILILLLILNLLILFYHKYFISLPAITLDAHGYIALYHMFKDNILGFINEQHYTRVLVPYLASLIPVSEPVLAFKILNTIFLNAFVLLLYKIWKALGINIYLISIAFFWLFFHQYGPVRFYNFWPTSIDVPTYFFNTCFIYILLKKQYSWLLLLDPTAVLQHDGFLVLPLLLLIYIAGSYYFGDNNTKKFRQDIFFIVGSILLIFIAKMIPGAITPQGFEDVILQRFIYNTRLLLGDEFLMRTVRVFVIYFSAYGVLLLLYIQNRKLSQGTDFTNMLIFFILGYASMLIVFGIINSRITFILYPFIMTLILNGINKIHPFLIGFSFFISLPLMRLFVPFPFGVKYIMFEHANEGFLAMIGLYMVIAYALLSYIRRSELLIMVENYHTKIKASLHKFSNTQ